MSAEWIPHRIAAIATRLEGIGFERHDLDDTLVLHRRKFELSRLGLVDAVVALAAVDGEAAPDDVERLESFAVAQAKGRKTRIPRGLGSAVEVFPVTLAEGISDDAEAVIDGGPPNAWSLITVPAVVHDGGRAISVYEGRKVWGGAYFSSIRNRLKEWIAD
ncbi:MAG: hypothetical protein AAGA99_23330 [Actinomycetota bacterium]